MGRWGGHRGRARDHPRDAIADGSEVSLVGAGLTVIAVTAAFFLREIPFRKTHGAIVPGSALGWAHGRFRGRAGELGLLTRAQDRVILRAGARHRT